MSTETTRAAQQIALHATLCSALGMVQGMAPGIIRLEGSSRSDDTVTCAIVAIRGEAETTEFLAAVRALEEHWAEAHRGET